MACNRPRSPLFKSCNQRFPPLAKQVWLQFLCIKTLYVPTKCLRNQLGMARIIGFGKWNWCSLTCASLPLTKIIDRLGEWRLVTSPHSDCFYKKAIKSHFLDLLKEKRFALFLVGISTWRISRYSRAWLVTWCSYKQFLKLNWKISWLWLALNY